MLPDSILGIMSARSSQSSLASLESDSDASTVFSSSPETSRERNPHARPSFRLPALNLASASPSVERTGDCSTRPVQYDLLSPAFALAPGTWEQAKTICSAKLGVNKTRIRFFELREINDLHNPAEIGRHVAIGIQDSELTLAALEGLLQECQLSRTQTESDNIKLLQARIDKLEAENQELRSMVKLLESLRKRGQHALKDIKKEFDILCQELIGKDGMTARGTGTPVALTQALMEAS